MDIDTKELQEYVDAVQKQKNGENAEQVIVSKEEQDAIAKIGHSRCWNRQLLCSRKNSGCPYHGIRMQTVTRKVTVVRQVA